MPPKSKTSKPTPLTQSQKKASPSSPSISVSVASPALSASATDTEGEGEGEDDSFEDAVSVGGGIETEAEAESEDAEDGKDDESNSARVTGNETGIKMGKGGTSTVTPTSKATLSTTDDTVQFKGKKWRKQQEAIAAKKVQEQDDPDAVAREVEEETTKTMTTGMKETTTTAEEADSPPQATTPTQTTSPRVTDQPPFDLTRTSLTETSLPPPASASSSRSTTTTNSSGAVTGSDTTSTSPEAEEEQELDSLSPLNNVASPSPPINGREKRHYSLSSEPETPSVGGPGGKRGASLSEQNHTLNNNGGGEFNSVSSTVYRNSRMVDVDLSAGVGLGIEEEGEGEDDREGDESGQSEDRKEGFQGPKMGKEGFDFLLARLDSQNSLIDKDPKAKRISNEKTSRIRQSFARIHRSAREDPSIDWAFWGAVMNDYEHVASTQPRELSRAIQLGIPPALRGMTWQLMAASKDIELERIYNELLKQTSPHEKSIQRDLSRTFPKHEYFQEIGGAGQENLFNVVKAYSLYDEEVGYTQGLQFIVGPLLLNMPDEEAFCVLVRLMKSYDLRSHYTPNMPGLQLRLFQFDRLVEELLPGVFMHLLRQGVKSSMYASQWFLTLFGYRFPLELVSSVFDLVFAEGVEAVFRFSVAILKKNEARICELEFEHLVEYLKNGLFETYAPAFDDPSPEPLYKAQEFVREALQVKITPLMLDQFGEEWDNLCRQQTAHTAEIENLRRANLQLSTQVRSLEASLAQINIEHCDLVKQVVLAKLEREELEDELVKYKIAFADLSHQQASSGSRFSQDQHKRSQLSIG